MGPAATNHRLKTIVGKMLPRNAATLAACQQARGRRHDPRRWRGDGLAVSPASRGWKLCIRYPVPTWLCRRRIRGSHDPVLFPPQSTVLRDGVANRSDRYRTNLRLQSLLKNRRTLGAQRGAFAVQSVKTKDNQRKPDATKSLGFSDFEGRTEPTATVDCGISRPPHSTTLPSLQVPASLYFTGVSRKWTRERESLRKPIWHLGA